MSIKMLVTNAGYIFYCGDLRVPRVFTPNTSLFKVDIFHALLNRREDEINQLVKEYHEKLNWNYANQGRGKNWPIFGRIERVLNQIQQQAGIVDT